MRKKYIKRHIDFFALKDEVKKIGVNFITAGVVGVFINHIVGSTFSAMFWTCGWVTFCGLVCLFLGASRREKS